MISTMAGHATSAPDAWSAV